RIIRGEIIMEKSLPSIINTSMGPIEYLDTGSGPAILCIHGAMGGYDQSITLAKTIGAPGYRYIAVSRPGYLGTPLSSGLTPEEQADLLAKLLDALQVKEVIVMAISGGGPSAMQFALRHNKRCQKLILCSTVGSPAANKIPMSFHVFTRLARIKPLVRLLKRKTEANLEQSMSKSISDPEILKKTLHNTEVMELFKVVLLGSFDRMADRVAGTKNDIRISGQFTCQYESITVPTLIVHGSKDPLVPFEHHGKILAESIPGAKLCLLEGGEHVAIFTHRNQVQKAVKDFLNQTIL
ncbi:MAG TPA: alpha/beta hydrolase, partial [Candidatus Margulisbacteria bacterium]|nr:alpha/beta hydrolase [Candidatus Margulisiibacteriota bacterium]